MNNKELTYLEFSTKIAEIIGYNSKVIIQEKYNKRGWMDLPRKYINSEYFEKQRSLYDDYETREVLLTDIPVGGMQGGSCFGGKPEPYQEEIKPLTFDLLDDIVLNFCPLITYVNYKAFYNKFVEHDNYTITEYYGNSTNYHRLCVDMNELYKFIMDNITEEKK
jgi:hypothetical protein